MTKPSHRVLEPSDRIAEVLFGLIMVLTFTGSLSVAEADRAEVKTMLIGALGCNLVWGIIDGVLYLMGSRVEKGREQKILNAARGAADPQQARRMIADALPEVVASVVQPAELETIRQRLMELPVQDDLARWSKRDGLGAVGVVLLVFLSTFPVAIPFLVMQNAPRALRVSNGIAIAMLFVLGYAYGECIHRRPWQTGILMVVLGCVLVGLTMALGG